MKPKYSIIVPVYNASKYLDECIQSIIDQSVTNWELILIDDGSTDGSGQICDKYAEFDSRIKCFHQFNKGASEARNQGLQIATGEWVSFVDADDWVSHDYLLIHDKKSCNADIFLFTIAQVWPDGNQLVRYPKDEYTEDRDNIERIIFNMQFGSVGDFFGYTVTKFFKAKIINQHHLRFDSELVFREDEIFTMDYCQYIHSIRTVKDTLYYYRFNPCGITSAGIKINDCRLLPRHIAEFIKSYRYPALVERELKRVNDYTVDYVLYTLSLSNFLKSAKELNLFLRKNSEYGTIMHLVFFRLYSKNYFLFIIELFIYCLYKKSKGYIPC